MSTLSVKCMHSYIFIHCITVFYTGYAHFEVPHTFQMSLKNVLVDVVSPIVVDSDNTSNYLCSIPLFL